jgi:hypothetical protein
MASLTRLLGAAQGMLGSHVYCLTGLDHALRFRLFVLLETFGFGVLVYWTILEQAVLLK